MGLRVASLPASFGGAVNEAPGCPVSPLLQLRLPIGLRVSPLPRSSGLTGDGSSSCLNSRILWRLREWSSRSPRRSASSVPPPDVAPGCPGAASSGLPTVTLRVSPNDDLPAWLWAQAPGYPDSCPIWPASGPDFEFPRIRDPLAAPVNGSPGFPESRTLRRRRLRSSGSPQILRLRLCRLASSSFPESCLCGWADVDSPAKLELCILGARPRMNLRVQSGLAHSRLTLDALLNSFSLPHRCRPRSAVSNSILHRPVRRELRFQFPTGLPTGWSVGRLNLWIQVQKETNPVDFTRSSALKIDSIHNFQGNLLTSTFSPQEITFKTEARSFSEREKAESNSSLRSLCYRAISVLSM